MPASFLVNRLATPQQLQVSASQLDGISRELEDSIRFVASKLVQSAGVLLHLPQETIARAIILLQRYFLGPDGASMIDHDLVDVIVAIIHISIKLTDASISIRGVLLVVRHLVTIMSEISLKTLEPLTRPDYDEYRACVYTIESDICRVLGYDLHVATPYVICVNYMQALDIYESLQAATLTRQAFRNLNTALLSPQMLYLTHQPATVAVAAIYLAARDLDVKLPQADWWEVFDVDREELGFLVVALQSVAKFVQAENEEWRSRNIPFTAHAMRSVTLTKS